VNSLQGCPSCNADCKENDKMISKQAEFSIRKNEEVNSRTQMAKPPYTQEGYDCLDGTLDLGSSSGAPGITHNFQTSFEFYKI